MKVGDAVFVNFGDLSGFATILKDLGDGQLQFFFEILFQGHIRMMHSDFMEVINESR